MGRRLAKRSAKCKKIKSRDIDVFRNREWEVDRTTVFKKESNWTHEMLANPREQVVVYDTALVLSSSVAITRTGVKVYLPLSLGPRSIGTKYHIAAKQLPILIGIDEHLLNYEVVSMLETKIYSGPLPPLLSPRRNLEVGTWKPLEIEPTPVKKRSADIPVSKLRSIEKVQKPIGKAYGNHHRVGYHPLTLEKILSLPRFQGKGMIRYKGPRCSVVKGVINDELCNVFVFNKDMSAELMKRNDLFNVELNVVPFRRRVRKHNIVTTYDAISVRPLQGRAFTGQRKFSLLDYVNTANEKVAEVLRFQAVSTVQNDYGEDPGHSDHDEDYRINLMLEQWDRFGLMSPASTFE